MHENNKVCVVTVLVETRGVLKEEFHIIATAPVASIVDNKIETVIVSLSTEELEQLRDHMTELLTR